MIFERLSEMAMARYVAALKAGTATPYECLRFLESAFSYREDDAEELERRAVLTLVRHDPLLLITIPQGGRVDGLTASDVDECVRSWVLEDEPLAALLEGHLRLAAASRHDPDRAQVARALAALERAEPAFRGDLGFLELHTDALERLGDPRYSAAVDQLLDMTPPEWQPHPLHSAMNEAVGRSDWERYDTLRRRWEGLPRNANTCQCATNYVANIDGLRALHRGDEEGAVRFLQTAVSVNGCPHLNTGGASLRLARELLDRNIGVAEVAEHLHAVEQYCVNDATRDLSARLAGRDA